MIAETRRGGAHTQKEPQMPPIRTGAFTLLIILTQGSDGEMLAMQLKLKCGLSTAVTLGMAEKLRNSLPVFQSTTELSHAGARILALVNA